ncbi:hypothetical protein TGAM01_v208770 [Trichoderma gamsii]|uniref:Uncharacterized protein n=1 Tax=Trichoderma gamsii TaxID=398673 RepID=A0A2P4ZDC0_9HYPO|nr:hypothetical protein TGAM01_v208770 [Trichoderma gamsii]PON22287.1 hypothetical protein TGAM01_v208770 [Trichoderma gamsii]
MGTLMETFRGGKLARDKRPEYGHISAMNLR